MKIELKKYLAEVGAKGGKAIRRKITPEQQAAMQEARKAKRCTQGTNGKAHLQTLESQDGLAGQSLGAAPCLLFHVTTGRKAKLYRQTGRINAPVRGFDTLMAAMAWAMKTGRKVIMRVEPITTPQLLPDHHNEYGRAWWTDSVPIERVKCAYSAEGAWTCPAMKDSPLQPDADGRVRCSAWFAMFLRIEAAYAGLRRAFGATPESEAVSVMYDAHAEYTKLVAEKVGDKDGWLEWYLWENGGGEKGLEAKAASWKKARKIKTLKDLEALIAA